MLLIPVNKGREQILYRYLRQGEEVLVEQSVSCRFVPLLGGVEKTSVDSPDPRTDEEDLQGEQLA